MEGIQLEKLGYSMDWGKSRRLRRGPITCEFLAETKSIKLITEILLIRRRQTSRRPEVIFLLYFIIVFIIGFGGLITYSS